MLDTQTVIKAEAPRRLCNSIDHTADMLDVSTATVYRLIRAKSLRTVRILGKTLVETAEIERFLDTARD